jgi:hypothetical protein
MSILKCCKRRFALEDRSGDLARPFLSVGSLLVKEFWFLNTVGDLHHRAVDFMRIKGQYHRISTCIATIPFHFSRGVSMATTEDDFDMGSFCHTIPLMKG